MIFFIIIKKNSQRIKNKNFKILKKKELWQHLILSLKGQKVFIDTDSDQIIQKCKKLFPWVYPYKREKKFINLENSKKASPTLLMIKNFLHKYVKNPQEIVVTTHITSPFLKLNTILKASKKLKSFESVCSVTKDYNFCWIKKNNKLVPVNFNPKIITKTQNLNPIIQSNGAFFIFKKKTFLKYNNRIANKNFYYEIKFPEALEIDEYEDLILARKICR